LHDHVVLSVRDTCLAHQMSSADWGWGNCHCCGAAAPIAWRPVEYYVSAMTHHSQLNGIRGDNDVRVSE
jgi:hypothetical protein